MLRDDSQKTLEKKKQDGLYNSPQSHRISKSANKLPMNHRVAGWSKQKMSKRKVYNKSLDLLAS